MRLYLIPVMAICFVVDLLLMMGANGLLGRFGKLPRLALAAALGAVYGSACLLPGFRFLGNGVWRLVSLAVMGVVAYGVDGEALRGSALFAVLNLAVGGLANGFGGGEQGRLLLAAAVVCVLCIGAVRRTPGIGSCVPVLLHYGENRIRIRALRDTGNSLRDPVTGESVLVVNADAASQLLGLSRDQLAHPVETVTAVQIPGLRLIPYRAVGKKCGMMLALRFEDAQIGSRCKSTLVAFAPEGLDGNGCFQALTGGMT